jgi:hypothetical protein
VDGQAGRHPGGKGPVGNSNRRERCRDSGESVAGRPRRSWSLGSWRAASGVGRPKPRTARKALVTEAGAGDAYTSPTARAATQEWNRRSGTVCSTGQGRSALRCSFRHLPSCCGPSDLQNSANSTPGGPGSTLPLQIDLPPRGAPAPGRRHPPPRRRRKGPPRSREAP